MSLKTLLLRVCTFPDDAPSSALPSVHEMDDLPPHPSMDPMSLEGSMWGPSEAGMGDLGTFPRHLGVKIVLAEANSGGCTGEEDADPMRRCSFFPCAMVMGFCSSTQQGWGGGKNPWENPAAHCTAETGATGRVHGGLPH